MKPSFLIVGAAGLVIAACAAHRKATDSSGPWKLVFADRTLIRSQKAFESALDDATTRWEQGITIKKKNGHVKIRQDHTNGQPEPTLSEVTYPRPSQPGPNTGLHVTQRIVLYTQQDYDAVLKTIRYRDDLSK
jgi:hypothetical protein